MNTPQTNFYDFLEKNQIQVRSIARQNNLNIDEIRSEIWIFFEENISRFNPRRTTLQAFVFGHLRKKIARYMHDVCSSAISLSDDSEQGARFKNEVEVFVSEAAEIVDHRENEGEASVDASSNQVPGAWDLATTADAVNGRTAKQMAFACRVTKRTINIRLKKTLEQSLFQYSIFDGGAQ